MKLVVAGLASRSCDWSDSVYPDVIRTLTPLTAGAVVEKVSKTPDVRRNSSVKNEPDVRAIRNALTRPAPELSVASSV
jgi:hypothetical protein